MEHEPETTLEIEFEDNRLLPLLFGERDRYLTQIEQRLNVSLHARGNHVFASGAGTDTIIAQMVLNRLYERVHHGHVVNHAEVEAAIRLAQTSLDPKGEVRDSSLASKAEVSISTRRKVVAARTPGQASYVRALQAHDLVFAVGPAGTGKTYLAVAMAVSEMLAGKVKRIVLSRPAVEAGENLGFLPGDIREKIDPYLRPLYDSLNDMLPPSQVARRMENGEIEIAPLAFMRGRTLSDAFVILDEAQNTTHAQMKMFLTRLGENSRMVVTGDLSQVDLPKGVQSGMKEALKVLKPLKEVSFVYLDETDIVRHGLVTKVVQAYDAFEKKYAAQ